MLELPLSSDVLNGSGLISKDVDSGAVVSDRLPGILSSDVGCEDVVGLADAPSPDGSDDCADANACLLLLELLVPMMQGCSWFDGAVSKLGVVPADYLMSFCSGVFFWYLLLVMKIGLGSLDGNGIGLVEGLWSSLNLLMVLILGTVVVIDVDVLDYY
ncbi:hypothetical protein Nepgr_021722 [Nepenthes gracilis]|uniref:Uncharacterized protein n=1 Tax=Nepenthes gracilis TaxID=150966 RepID=A0AAD3T1D4_NEPGR|nr:hypothetical protein Nepgr_021722 [Nepenthes gracilis]